MRSSPLPAPWLGRVLDAAAVFLGAFLLFQIQPMVSKYILPWFGGAPLVWATCLVFFQLALLGGYSYAHLLVSRFPPRAQALLHGGLLLLSLLALPGIPDAAWKPSGAELPTPRILGMLAASIGLPYFVLSSTSPLVQAWIARHRHHMVPYRLFSLSNLASIFGLLSYPFWIEPAIGLRLQFLSWSALYGLYVAAMLALIAHTFFRAHPPALAGSPPALSESPAASSPLPHPAWPQRLLWLGLAACPSILFLSLTNHLTQDVAPVPFLWVLPLVIYLLTFVLCFEVPNRLPLGLLRWGAVAMLVLLALSFVLRLLAASYVPELILDVAAVFLIGLFCHSELYARRPAPQHLTAFYLMVSAGGALGGSFVGLAAPYLFSGYYEVYVGLALCGLLAFLIEWDHAKARAASRPGKAEFSPFAAVPLFAAALAAAIPFAIAGEHHLRASRNFFGALTVTDVAPKDGDTYRRLDHGSTRHGLQFAYPPKRCEATTYFGPDGGAGLLLNTLRRQSPQLRAGIVGLGIGTLAAYARPADHYTFYEINPLVETIAREDFTYLSECSRGAQVRLGDARIELEREAPNAFDVFLVDAFSGDSIPTHLLTREAFLLYRKHLAPHGVIALNISNRYLQLAPVVAAGAQAIGFQARFILNPGNEDLGTFTSHWAILSRNPSLFEMPLLAPKIAATPQPDETLPWTDDYSNLFRVLR